QSDDDGGFFAALQELMAYAFEESVRIKKKGRLFPRWHKIPVRSSRGILQEVQCLLHKYCSELVRQTRLLGLGDPPAFVLINLAPNAFITRSRFLIRSWYRSPRLIRENPLPRSQFVPRRRFPRGSTKNPTTRRCAPRSGSATDRGRCSHPDLVRAAPPLRPDMIFARHRCQG